MKLYELAISDTDRFDLYRRNYDRMTIEDHRKFYDWVVSAFPEQSYWDGSACRMFLAAAQPKRVVELGGWDGGLAAAMLSEYPGIRSWVNCEIAEVTQVVDDQRYECEVLDDNWFWESPLAGDAFVASHVLEHLSLAHLEALLGALDGYSHLFLTVPLPREETPDWDGYLGSHVLPLSWVELEDCLKLYDWNLQGSLGPSRWYSKEPSSYTIPKRDKVPLADSPGTIAIPTSEMQRFLLFTLSLASTDQPPDCYLNATASASVTENLNEIMRQLRTQGVPLVKDGPPSPVTDRWVWIMGDDHCWKNDALVKMLWALDEYPEIDVLVPLVTKRNPPWHLVLFDELHEQTEDGIPTFRPLHWENIPASGVFEVDAAGSAGMLVRREVIDALADPWFYSTTDTEGRQVVLNEDVTFCTRIRHEHGFRLFATADVTLGHLGIFNVRPLHNGERWGALTEFASMEDRFRHVFMPVEEPND